MSDITNKLSELTQEFTASSKAFRLFDDDEKAEAIKILNDFYGDVKAIESEKDGRHCWVIKAENPVADSGEADESDFSTEDDGNFAQEGDFDDYSDDFNAMDADMDTEDDMDLSDLELDTIDDTSEVDAANEITLLKKKAFDLSNKWKETFKRINELARKIDLVATTDDDLNIILKKANGSVSKYKDDVEFMNKVDELNTNRDSSIDDSFGPSDYDSRANSMFDAQPMTESADNQLHPQMVVENFYPADNTNSNMSTQTMSDPNELPLNECDVDDDF